MKPHSTHAPHSSPIKQRLPQYMQTGGSSSFVCNRTMLRAPSGEVLGSWTWDNCRACSGYGPRTVMGCRNTPSDCRVGLVGRTTSTSTRYPVNGLRLEPNRSTGSPSCRWTSSGRSWSLVGGVSFCPCPPRKTPTAFAGASELQCGGRGTIRSTNTQGACPRRPCLPISHPEFRMPISSMPRTARRDRNTVGSPPVSAPLTFQWTFVDSRGRPMSGPSRRYRVRFAKLATALRFRRYQLDALEFCTW